MSRVFMVFAASGENLFEARCGAKDFFDSLKAPRMGSFFDGLNYSPCALHLRVI